eukprot:5067965-Prymnesium_polylepis.1
MADEQLVVRRPEDVHVEGGDAARVEAAHARFGDERRLVLQAASPAVRKNLHREQPLAARIVWPRRRRVEADKAQQRGQQREGA